MAERERTNRRFDPRALPLAVKLTLGAGLAMLLSWLIIHLLYQQVVWTSQLDLARADMQWYTRVQALRVVDVLKQEIASLDVLGDDAQIRELVRSQNAAPRTDLVYVHATQLDDQISRFMAEHEGFETVAVMSANGHVLSVGIDELPQGFEQMEVPESLWPWFSSAWNSGQGTVYVTSGIDDQLTGKRGVHIVVPIDSPESSDNVLGLIYAVWNMQNLQEMAGDLQTLVIQTDGTVLLAPSETYYHNSMLTSLTSGAASNTFVFRDNAGDTWLYGFDRMEALSIDDAVVSNLPWIFASRKSMTTIQAAVELLMSRLRSMMGVSAIAVTVLILMFSFSLFRPLRRLTDAAVAIGQGNLTESVPQFPLDEIGRLANALSQVVGQLTGRLEQLRAVVQVSHSTGLTLDTDKMLAETAQSIGKHFDFTEVRIFLVDLAGKQARLRAASGGESEQLLRSGFRVAVDETTVVGRSILLNEPVIVGGKGAFREASAIPVHSEMALPLQTGGETIGAIHLITSHTREFEREDIDILHLLTDQLGASIQNARLFEQSAANLAEIEALNRRLTRQAWEEYIGESGTMRHTLDPDGQWPQVIAEARQSTEIKAEVYTDADGRLVLAAPLVLRGEAVGTLAVTRPAGETWTRDEALLLESIASRMGIIAESIRLVEASARHVEREQRVNEVSANLLQRASSVDTVLRSALTELSGALGSDRVSLRIGGLPARDGRQITAGFTEEQFDARVAPESSDVPESPDTDGDGGMISQ